MRALRWIAIGFGLVAISCATSGEVGYGVGVYGSYPGYYDTYYDGIYANDFVYPYGVAPYVYGGGYEHHYPYAGYNYGYAPQRNVTVARPPQYNPPPPAIAAPPPSAPAGRPTTIARPPGR
jgi:hypothetical protein